MKNESLNVLLGAGFSRKLNLPLAQEILGYFTDIKGKIHQHSNSSWHWREDLGTSLPPYRSSNEVVIEYIYKSLIEDFEENNPNPDNYEEFFSYFLNKNDDWDVIRRNARNYYFADNEDEREEVLDVSDRFESFEIKNVHDSFQYLVASRLAIKEIDRSIQQHYDPFINFLRKYQKVNIFTLNHDLVVEHLLDQSKIGFSDGFSSENSPITGYEGNPLKYFNDTFDRSISIFKLHGSIDTMGYDVGGFKGPVLSFTGDILYFKNGSDEFESHMAKRINPQTQEVIQDFVQDPSPKFLTGILKKQSIESDYMYSQLFGHFNDEMANKNSDFLCIGYRFEDEHIQSVLDTLKAEQKININPNDRAPWSGFRNLRELKELLDV